MSQPQPPEEVQRWTAKRKAAVVLDLVRGKITTPDAARHPRDHPGPPTFGIRRVWAWLRYRLAKLEANEQAHMLQTVKRHES